MIRRPFVVLGCGSRTWQDQDEIIEHFKLLRKVDDAGGDLHLIHGNAPGADRMAAYAALQLGWEVTAYPADWDTHGKAAGFIRNQMMLDEGKPDLLIAFWDGKSRGTLDMIRRAGSAGVDMTIVSAKPNKR